MAGRVPEGLADPRRAGCLGKVGNIRLGAEQGCGLTSLGFNRPVPAAGSEVPVTVIISRSAASQRAGWELRAPQRPLPSGPLVEKRKGQESLSLSRKVAPTFIVMSVQTLVFACSSQDGRPGVAPGRCLWLTGSLQLRVAMESVVLTWA